jgi:hypothetical protein
MHTMSEHELEELHAEYLEASAAERDGRATLRAMNADAEQGIDSHQRADDFRHYALAELTEARLDIAGQLLDQLGYASQ